MGKLEAVKAYLLVIKEVHGLEMFSAVNVECH